MDIAQELHGQVLVVAPSGRLDSETSGELELVLHDAGTAGRRHFVIDLAAVTYVSSAGLRVLLALAKRLDGGVGSVRLCNMSASVRQVFDISGFTSMFSLFPNRIAALDKHPHVLDASAALVDAASALLGASARTPAGEPSDARTATAAELLGAPTSQEELTRRSTIVGPAVKAAVVNPPAAQESRWKKLFGKD
jgi:anti-anti-sigma factor